MVTHYQLRDKIALYNLIKHNLIKATKEKIFYISTGKCSAFQNLTVIYFVQGRM